MEAGWTACSRMEGAGWMAGWMDGGHARPVGERRKAAVSHDAGTAASWRAPTPPNHNGVTTERRPPAGHLPPFKRHAPILVHNTFRLLRVQYMYSSTI
jgi:hypothetical protein